MLALQLVMGLLVLIILIIITQYNFEAGVAAGCLQSICCVCVVNLARLLGGRTQDLEPVPLR
eukprot:CAMPEP_0173237942 /NCGR_PEP_ID=MMETSP1142-20121109/12348_1 /TAXON_ID=483371 /ORGANISM="non described non described, Strain CCMP2298" /LENGTH=61 /DNA_ID=CAMNT_0014168723 /DNA_START=34 /DNA_END=215 /DNA_ORIENTATION=-